MYYQAADAFVFASTSETQGLAVLEAMACGLPVVAVRASGIEEIVTDGVSGLLVPEDAAALAEPSMQILADGHLRAKLGARRPGGRLLVRVDGAGQRLVAAYRRARGAPAWS